MTRNVVLIVLDTVRKDYFDRFAPRLQGLSDVTLTECRATSTWSVPSHVSMFSGELPHQHGAHAESFTAAFDFQTGLADGTRFFTDDLSDHRSIGISSNIYMNEHFGFDEFFDAFFDHSIGSHKYTSLFPDAASRFDPPEGFETSRARWLYYLQHAVRQEYPLKSLANGLWRLVGDWVEELPIADLTDDGAAMNAHRAIKEAETSSEPFFLFLNFMDAHTPLRNVRAYDQHLHSASNRWSSNQYDRWTLLNDGSPDAEYTRNYRQLYGAAIDYLDRTMADLIEDLHEVTENDTTMIITADHGHNLGYESEAGLFHHTASTSEGVMHVPFEIVNPPSGAPSKITKLVSHTELADLVRALAADEWPAGLGEMEWIGAENVGFLGKTDPAESGLADPRYWNRMIRCAYNGAEKYEWDSLGESYHYQLDPGDPCEQELLEEDCEVPSEAMGLFEVGLMEYKDVWETKHQDLGFDAQTRGQLKELGYL